ncbi:MAG: LacI family transcriptional regulator [Cytophagales bacterium]|nr:LacI family transcriptional regulator [Cytophagales bacterium]
MSKGQATIKDIAKALRISVSTVSRALHDHPDISEKTKKAVREEARRLDYQPNLIAQGLRQQKSHLIGLIVPEIVHHFFSTTLSGVEDFANSQGYHVMVCQSNESYEREKTNVKALLSSRVDGIIVSVSKETTDFSHFKHIQKRGIPLVFMDRICNEVKAPSVVCQDYEGAYMAAEHFISHGRRRIAHLRGPKSLLISKQRLNGYLDVLSKHRIPKKDEYIVFASDFESGYRETLRLLDLHEKPDAIFAVNDITAAGSLRALQEKGFRVPEDISVIGFGDDPVITKLTVPKLSSIYQPGYEMGKMSAQMLLKNIGVQEPFPHEIRVLKTELKLRETTL